MLENMDAWEAYTRVCEQIFMYPVSADGKEVRVALRTEAVTAIIGLMSHISPLDPVETFDRVLMIHNLKYHQ